MQNDWDDYGFKTSFNLLCFDQDGNQFDIGFTKIVEMEQEGGFTAIDNEFDFLKPSYCSLGQSQTFYENMLQIPEPNRSGILSRLRDIVWNEGLIASFEQTKGFKKSLMRSVSQDEINRFMDIIHERSRLTPFYFGYKFPEGSQTASSMIFDIVPEQIPPSNIHVVIGRNGVGKTRLLSAISELLRVGAPTDRSIGSIRFSARGTMHFLGESVQGVQGKPDFSKLVSVAFSAFDNFEPPATGAGTRTGIVYEYIGLRSKSPAIESGMPGAPRRRFPLKAVEELVDEFESSLEICLRSSRQRRWHRAMTLLETDPIFAELSLTGLTDLPVREALISARRLFEVASSGHKIVLITMTRLVELVDERTLVLIDEPEAHLHPPLQASFIRALSDLLTYRNGVGLLATHSPVMLQEVPRNCVWMLFRTGNSISIERPTIETFAENHGTLASEVFRVEMERSGYHALIKDAVDTATTFEEVLEKFNGHLGAEGRSVARVLWRTRR